MSWLKKNLLYILISVVGLLLAINIIIHYWNGWSVTVVGTTIFNNLIMPFTTIISIGIYTWTLWELIKQNRINHSNNLKPHFEWRINSILRRLNEKQFVRIEQREVFSCFDLYPYLRLVEDKLKKDTEYHSDIFTFNLGSPRNSEHYIHKHYVKHHINFLEPFALQGIAVYDQVQALIKEIKNSGMIEVDIVNFKGEIRFEMIDPYINFIDDISLAENQYLIPLISEANSQDSVSFVPLGQSNLRRHYDYFIKELYPERSK